MTELNMKQNDTASEVITNEGANNVTEPKIDAIAQVEQVINCFNTVHTFWRSCNEKLYEGLAELYGVVKDASDADIKAICTRYKVEYETLNHIEVIFKATFDSAFKDELCDERFETRFCERRKIYKMAVKNMLEQGLTKEQALNELKAKGVEAVARGKSKEIKKTTSQAANQTDDASVSKMINKNTITYKLTQAQKAIIDAVTDNDTPDKVKSDFVILRYNNDDVIGANRQSVIKKMWDYTEHSNTYKGVEPFVVIVPYDEQGVGNPPSSNDDAVDENGADNEKE